MIYLFETFEGNPLNSRANYSKVKVKNPDPAANLEYYSSFGKPDQCVREKGIDWVTFKTLNYILPAVEDHAKWRKTQKKKKPWFRLKPDDENKASPQFCILKRNYNPDNQHEKLLNYCKERFPKKEVFVKKSSVVSNAFPKETTPPTKVDPVPQINTKKETGKEVIKKENTTVVKQEKKEETKKTDNIKTTKPYVIIEKKEINIEPTIKRIVPHANIKFDLGQWLLIEDKNSSEQKQKIKILKHILKDLISTSDNIALEIVESFQLKDKQHYYIFTSEKIANALIEDLNNDEDYGLHVIVIKDKETIKKLDSNKKQTKQK